MCRSVKGEVYLFGRKGFTYVESQRPCELGHGLRKGNVLFKIYFGNRHYKIAEIIFGIQNDIADSFSDVKLLAGRNVDLVSVTSLL